MNKKFEKLTKLGEELSQLTGMEHKFAGSNGEYCCCVFSPFAYLREYHTLKEMTLYVEALIAGLRYGKSQAGEYYSRLIQMSNC